MPLRIQNKVAWTLVMALSLLVIAALAGVVQGGPLDPTAPPGSTGKNVITQVPFTIGQPGSYILNGNLSCASCGGFVSGITVNADNVTINLEGFELVGGPTAGYGINAPGRQNLSVINGTIRNWPSGGIWARDGGAGAVIDGLRLKANGLGIAVGNDSILSDCRVEDSSSAQGIIVGDRSTITNCSAFDSVGIGIQAGWDVTMSNVSAGNNGNVEILTGPAATIENCNVNGNFTPEDGLRVGAASVIRGCTSVNNGAEEIEGGNVVTVENCVADGASTDGIGILVGSDSTVRNCTARNNAHGQIYTFDGSLVEDCVASGYRRINEFAVNERGPGSGIIVWNKSTVRGCVVNENEGYGIYVFQDGNRIEGNHVMDNGTGIMVDGLYNIGMQNYVSCNSGQNFDIVATNPPANDFYPELGSYNVTDAVGSELSVSAWFDVMSQNDGIYDPCIADSP